MADISQDIPRLSRQWLAALNRWRKRPFDAIDHDAVMAHLAAEGGISVRYGVLIALACGIAILGLLQSSAAVVIGAMLISPLMSPIILLGFSLATLDPRLGLRALRAIGLGTALAVGLAAIIVWVSPLNAVTPEILARTKPNFFDLLVAILSAIAAGYAVAQSKGETIVGVAIATALMPPLAVVGYGLAVGNWAIFLGAGGMFMTNLLAIGLTASLVAKFFGFGHGSAAQAGLLHIACILATFAILSIPLGLSLKHLAAEAIASARVRGTLNAAFVPPDDHVYGINIAFPDDGPVRVEALVLVQTVQPGRERQVENLLRAALGRPVALALSQAPVHPRESLDRQAVEQLVHQSSASAALQIQENETAIAMAAAAETGRSRLDISMDDRNKTVRVHGAAGGAEDLARLRSAMDRLAARYPGWHFTARPDLSALPPIHFSEGEAVPDAQNTALIDDIIWALRSGGVGGARVTGYADSQGGTRASSRAALRRANAVRDKLRDAGIAVQVVSGFPEPDQRRQEQEQGRAAFRSVRIVPAQP